ncbi:uncharacterized protein si:ch211-151h10.2 [Mugil cephalus]|uniref:uncharacterized protein si:ch211-151h10.2 n=1 Tax=Mugil cephalus TaxID=48193 RepID=UPI001FB6277F|nr:uncharacterized protein si:ch211-151h10.2 [Mugil cephalus]
MPSLTVSCPKIQRVAGRREGVSWDSACKWMEEAKKDGERETQKLQSSNQTPDNVPKRNTSWAQISRTSLRPWYSLAPVGVVWSVCQLEALSHPSVSPLDVCWRLLSVCLLWIILGGCFRVLKCRLQPGHKQGEPPQSKQQEFVNENRSNQYSRMSQPSRPGIHLPLTLALADALLLCVLQEPLGDPSVPHIQALLSRLESVAHTLEKADTGPEVTLEEMDSSSIVMDKLQLIRTYLQQRIASLRALVQAQRDFEASVKEMLQGLDGLWAQLEELHAGVTLSKQGSQGQVALASAQKDAQTLFTVLGHYRIRLQSCQAHLNGSTQLLQDLTWSHAHTSNSVNSSSESVWTELLLQSNIEQFDKVQENFISLEQQTSTFQAHLEGLGKVNQKGHVGPLALANGAHSRPASPQTSTREGSLGHRNSTSSSASFSSVDADAETGARLSLFKKSALQLSSTIGCLRKSAGKK